MTKRYRKLCDTATATTCTATKLEIGMTQPLTYEPPKGLQSLLDEPKGKVEYFGGEAFLLHVFWEVPSMTAAMELLSGLNACALATHRDTPCVPTYLFRVSNNDTGINGAPPTTVGEHPVLREAKRKLQVGVSRGAVCAELVRRGLDPELLDLELTAELPEILRTQQPIAVECTELYLDERGFMEHAGSRDYLDGYGIVMRPSLQFRVPITLRLGTPAENIREKILEPVLKENVMPVAEGCTVWQHDIAPLRSAASTGAGAVFLSFDAETRELGNGACLVPKAFSEHCSTFVSFPHPLRANTTRVMCVLPTLPTVAILSQLLSLHPIRGEAHTNEHAHTERARSVFAEAGLGVISVDASECVGYVLHGRARELRSIGTRS